MSQENFQCTYKGRLTKMNGSNAAFSLLMGSFLIVAHKL